MAEETAPEETNASADRDWQADADKWKALARKHEEQAKANAAAAKRLAEIEAAQKTQAEKDAEEKTALARERDDARLSLLRRDAAEEAGLPKSWASRLQGSTAEELLADAKALAKDLPAKAAPPTTGGRPVQDLRPGALPAGDRATAGGGSREIDAYIRRQVGIQQ